MAAIESVLAGLQERVRAAAADRHPLAIRGGGTRAFYGEPQPRVPDSDWLDVSAYRGVVDHAPAELVLTARAGTPLAEVETLLAAHNQMLAFEPPRFGAADTLGGCIATGLSGPRRVSAGRVSDFVLGTRLLNGAGDILRFGGEVMKNVAGYDVSRLLAGSLGALGAIVEISLKVIPRPRCEATRVFELDEAAALKRCLAWRPRPLPLSATAWIPDATGAAGTFSVRVAGNESAVREGLAEIGGEALPDDQADTFWSSLRDQTHPFFAQRPLWRVVLPPKAPPLELGPVLHEWSGGLRWLAGTQDAASLRARIGSLGGWACLYRREGAPDAIPTFHPVAPAVLRIQQRLKHEFDPAGVFDARRLLGEP